MVSTPARGFKGKSIGKEQFLQIKILGKKFTNKSIGVFLQIKILGKQIQIKVLENGFLFLQIKVLDFF